MTTSRFAMLSLVLGLALSVMSCGGSDEAGAVKDNGKTANGINPHEYQLLRTELKLAKSEKPYLLINFADKKLQIKMKGAVVWSYPMQMVEDDPDAFASFIDHFEGPDDRLVRPLTETHLFASQVKTPDSILAIISEVTKVRPELLQRQLPERFQMLWGDDLILEVLTDVKGKPQDKFKNTVMEVRQAITAPFGQAFLSIKMDSVSALTLYRAAEPGLPTMIYPPSS